MTRVEKWNVDQMLDAAFGSLRGSNYIRLQFAHETPPERKFVQGIAKRRQLQNYNCQSWPLKRSASTFPIMCSSFLIRLLTKSDDASNGDGSNHIHGRERLCLRRGRVCGIGIAAFHFSTTRA